MALQPDDSLPMTFIATLIGAPDANIDIPALARQLTKFLPQAQVPVSLDQSRVFDIAFRLADATALDEWRQRALDRIQDHPVDIILQASHARKKRLLIADMDSTMIGQECIDELADFAGVKARVAAITERAMRGEIAFEPALRARVALLKGLPTSIIDKVIAERIHLTPGGPTLIATMRKNGAYTALISGGFTVFTQKIAAKIGFDEQQANVLLQQNDHFIGEVAEPILGRAAKRAALERLSTAHLLTPDQTMAVGDGANDLDMLQGAGLGIAFHAKPQVAAAAHAAIRHNDLTALLFAQGYRRDEFITPPAF